MADAQVLVNHLDHRGQAVGGARSGGDDTVLRRVEQVLVDAHHHVQCAFLLHWSADHHTFDALIQVGLEHGYRLHLAAGLDDQVAARPVCVRDGLVRGDLEALAFDHYRVAFCAGFTVPASVDRIEVDQMGMGLGVTGRVIDLHKLEFWPVPGRAKRQATNTAKPIDTYFDSHVLVLGSRLTNGQRVSLNWLMYPTCAGFWIARGRNSFLQRCQHGIRGSCLLRKPQMDR
ncbi:hypothetical protein D3C73_1193330 [compost metagenome]